MNDYSAFVRAICENPEDDGLRLIFADWLDDNGQWGRAAFVRWCVRNRDVEGGRTRQPHVHPSSGWRFDSSIPGLKSDWYLYRRGFVSLIRLPLADFLTRAKDLFETHPIERVVLTDREPLHTREGMLYCDVRMPECYSWVRQSVIGESDAASRLMAMYKSAIPDEICAFIPIASRSAAKSLLILSDACVRYARELAGLPELARLHPELTGN